MRGIRDILAEAALSKSEIQTLLPKLAICFEAGNISGNMKYHTQLLEIPLDLLWIAYIQGSISTVVKTLRGVTLAFQRRPFR